MTIDVQEFGRLTLLLLDKDSPIKNSELQELYPAALQRIIETAYGAVASSAGDAKVCKIYMNEVRIASLTHAMCVLELLNRKDAFKDTKLDEIRVALETIVCYYSNESVTLKAELDKEPNENIN